MWVLNKFPEPGPSDEDELFEAGMISTNKVYRLDDENRLQFVPEYSGVTLQCSILKPSEVVHIRMLFISISWIVVTA